MPPPTHVRDPTRPTPLEPMATQTHTASSVTASSRSSSSPAGQAGPSLPPSSQRVQGLRHATPNNTIASRESGRDGAKHDDGLPDGSDAVSGASAAKDQSADALWAALTSLKTEAHALRVENAMLRQRVAALSSVSAHDDDDDTRTGAEAGAVPVQGPPVPLLLAHIRRLEAALTLEAMEREGLERRVLAQEGVLLSLQLEKQKHKQ